MTAPTPRKPSPTIAVHGLERTRPYHHTRTLRTLTHRPDPTTNPSVKQGEGQAALPDTSTEQASQAQNDKYDAAEPDSPEP
jgi:hypothetical protein